MPDNDTNLNLNLNSEAELAAFDKLNRSLDGVERSQDKLNRRSKEAALEMTRMRSAAQGLVRALNEIPGAGLLMTALKNPWVSIGLAIGVAVAKVREFVKAVEASSHAAGALDRYRLLAQLSSRDTRELAKAASDLKEKISQIASAEKTAGQESAKQLSLVEMVMKYEDQVFNAKTSRRRAEIAAIEDVNEKKKQEIKLEEELMLRSQQREIQLKKIQRTLAEGAAQRAGAKQKTGEMEAAALGAAIQLRQGEIGGLKAELGLVDEKKIEEAAKKRTSAFDKAFEMARTLKPPTAGNIVVGQEEASKRISEAVSAARGVKGLEGLLSEQAPGKITIGQVNLAEQILKASGAHGDYMAAAGEKASIEARIAQLQSFVATLQSKQQGAEQKATQAASDAAEAKETVKSVTQEIGLMEDANRQSNVEWQKEHGVYVPPKASPTVGPTRAAQLNANLQRISRHEQTAIATGNFASGAAWGAQRDRIERQLQSVTDPAAREMSVAVRQVGVGVENMKKEVVSAILDLRRQIDVAVSDIERAKQEKRKP